MKVYWSVFNGSLDVKMSWVNIALSDPEPAYKSLVSSRNKDVIYFKCPAVQDYFKNTFVVRSPVDITISIDNGCVRTHEYDQKFFDIFINSKTNNGIDRYETIIFAIDYLFYSDEPCLVEQLPAFMEDSALQRSIRIIPGTFDISKWIRPLQCSFEVIDPSSPIVIKRGDPLFYVRLIPKDNSKVTLERVNVDSNLHQVVTSCLTLKSVITNNSLKQNYEMAKSYLSLWKRGRKKSKCPFHFWK